MNSDEAVAFVAQDLRRLLREEAAADGGIDRSPPFKVTPTKGIAGEETTRPRLILQRAADHLVEHVLRVRNGGDNVTVIILLFSVSDEFTQEGSMEGFDPEQC
ncbi:unnamed protein product [Phytomonas sp. EM1]|nr:unnamed protein product [Phytomonas sp. EM1]|eukprot:CCW61081.1 unnamed protein product [Phytomonas sp. isolate EM1]